MSELYIQYGPMVLTFLLMALAAGGNWLIANKIKSAKVAGMLVRAGQELEASVLMVSNTYIKESKRLNEVNEGGPLTADQKARAMRVALDTFKANYGAAGLLKLAKILGLPNLDGWLETQAEAIIATMKIQSPPKA